MADGQRVWEAGPMPPYCAARGAMLDLERKHLAGAYALVHVSAQPEAIRH
jgi:endogenous inhibitor of DNA gyrase (YacG/DUF329 family)